MKDKSIKETLVVLDYSDSSVNIYGNVPDMDNPEDLLKHYGHDIDQCSWMICEKVRLNINLDS
mgnify:CR=1 FL=1